MRRVHVDDIHSNFTPSCDFLRILSVYCISGPDLGSTNGYAGLGGALTKMVSQLAIGIYEFR